MTTSEREGNLAPYSEMEGRALSAIPDWDDFRILLTVVKSGSFKRAADELGISQPTVSRRIARLESIMRAQLVDRTNNGAALTLDGQRIMEELNLAHDALHRAVRRSQSRDQQKHDVKIITTDGLATYWLSHFWDAFFDLHPDISLKVFTMNDTVTDRRGHFDLSIHYLPQQDMELMTTRLGTLHFIPYASPAYLKKHGKPTSVEALANHRLTDMTLYVIDKGSWMTRLPNEIGQDRTQLFSNSSAMLAEAVRHGAGIGLIPTYASAFEQGLEPIELGLHQEAPFWLCYRQDALDKPSIRSTIRFIKHVFNRRAMPWFQDRYVSPAAFQPTSVSKILSDYSPTATTLVQFDEHVRPANSTD